MAHKNVLTKEFQRVLVDGGTTTIKTPIYDDGGSTVYVPIKDNPLYPNTGASENVTTIGGCYQMGGVIVAGYCTVLIGTGQGSVVTKYRIVEGL